MPVRPIEARCHRCDERLYLFELVDRRSAACPRCGYALSPDWSELLIEESVRADVSMRELMTALRRLAGLPGNLVVNLNGVLRNLVEEVAWTSNLDDPSRRTVVASLRRWADEMEAGEPRRRGDGRRKRPRRSRQQSANRVKEAA